ncbi:MAG: capsid cement protein [Planctomycetota bacterium]
MLRFWQLGNPISVEAATDLPAGHVIDLAALGYPSEIGSGVSTSPAEAGELQAYQIGGIFVHEGQYDDGTDVAAFAADTAVSWDPATSTIVETAGAPAGSIPLGKSVGANLAGEEVKILLNGRPLNA